MSVVILWLLAQCTLASPPAAGSDVWWSLRPLVQPTVPTAVGEDRGWIRNPIDAFIAAKLQEKGLSHAGEADRRTLIRRLSFDLVGLPPTPQEVDAFLRDQAPHAYERLVDRLLASPRYGERWARHWMDVVHYGESHGHDQDRVRPNAWPYRDYLIQAFNDDRPYARFIEEQVAGDVLHRDRPERLPALGMLAAGPWDESSLRDIRDDSIDRQVGYYLDRDDMVTTCLSTFVSLTVHCARCHDHKFDPISQKDYYRLQAVFAGVGRGDREYKVDPSVAERRRALQAELEAIRRKDDSVRRKSASESVRSQAAAWYKSQFDDVRWATFEPTNLSSMEGSKLTLQKDGSILSTGPRPERDVYTVMAKTTLSRVTAVRLELLPDPALPHRGPGRQDNGNLHLSEIELFHNGVRIPIASAVSDYDQPGWTIQHAVDGDPRTAWGIYPKVGEPHVAVLTPKQPIVNSSASEWSVRLVQVHGGGHLIGRFRISATADVPPKRATLPPSSIAAALNRQPKQRSTADWETLGLYFLEQEVRSRLEALPKPNRVYGIGKDFLPDGGHKPVANPRQVNVLRRGDIRKPGEEVGPGTLACISTQPGVFEINDRNDEGTRRAALARWLSDGKNPLTWRSIVNRVWHYHFGRGIVDTPNDFGKMGSPPTHPELLDWLAVQFRDGGGSLKSLHRLIVCSATYRQSSQSNPAKAAKDAEAKFLWRQQRRRFDAECIRDSVLQAGEMLDLRMGGPSDQQFAMRPGIHVTPVVEYGKFDWDRPQKHRRGVYRFVFRTLPDPFMECLDCADASQLTAARTLSVSGPQSLALLDNEFVLVGAKWLAAAMERHSKDRREQIREACRRLWNRAPADHELTTMTQYAEHHGMTNLCRVLLNTNEFLFVD